MPTIDSKLPARLIANAKLPGLYVAARAAIEKCTRIDECKDWADKAVALASYARQVKDERLKNDAVRIQERALKQAGKLVNEIQASKGGRPGKTHTGDGTSSRAQAAQDAGLSKRQKDTALRLASVSDADFDAQVESDHPPSVQALAKQGTKPRVLVDLKGVDPADYARTTHAWGGIKRFRELTEEITPEQALRGAAGEPHIARAMIADAKIISLWIERLLREEIPNVEESQTRNHAGTY